MAANNSAVDGIVTARVSSVTATDTEVLAQVGQACGNCSAKCGVPRPSQVSTVWAKVQTTGPFIEGQLIVLDTVPGAVAQISLSLYLLPSTGFLIGACAAYLIGLGDVAQALLGLAGLLAGLSFARRFLRRKYGAVTPLCGSQITDNLRKY